MPSDDSLLRRAYDLRFPGQDREETPRLLRVLFGETPPLSYAERPSYGEVFDVWPTFTDDVKKFTDDHIKGLVREWEKSNPPETRVAPPKKDWSADPFAEAQARAATLPPKDWTGLSKPRGPSDGP